MKSLDDIPSPLVDALDMAGSSALLVHIVDVLGSIEWWNQPPTEKEKVPRMESMEPPDMVLVQCCCMAAALEVSLAPSPAPSIPSQRWEFVGSHDYSPCPKQRSCLVTEDKQLESHNVAISE